MSAPITLTNAQLESVAQGLSALDGLQTKDGFIPYRFSEDTTWELAVKGAAFTQAISLLNTALKSLAKQHGVTEGMKITDADREKVSAFFEAKSAILEKPAVLPADLTRISRSALNVAKNQIPPGVLVRLMPVLEP